MLQYAAYFSSETSACPMPAFLLAPVAVAGVSPSPSMSLKSRLVKPALLLVDVFGNGEMNLTVELVLLDIVDRRMRCGSLLITSQ